MLRNIKENNKKWKWWYLQNKLTQKGQNQNRIYKFFLSANSKMGPYTLGKYGFETSCPGENSIKTNESVSTAWVLKQKGSTLGEF